MATEETLVLVKPDGVARGLTGAILARIEAKGYALVDIRLVEPDRETLEKHYAEHEGKPFYEPLLDFMMSGPSVAIRLAGNRVIEGFRSLAGTTDPTTAAPGTIRGDFGRDWGLKVQQNLVHGSDSPESAARELEHLVLEQRAEHVQAHLGEDRDHGVADDGEERHPAHQPVRPSPQGGGGGNAVLRAGCAASPRRTSGW